MIAKHHCKIQTRTEGEVNWKDIVDIVDNLLYYAKNDSQSYKCSLV